MMESKRKYLTIDINSTFVFSTVDSFIGLKFPVNQVAITANNKFIIAPPLTIARMPLTGKLRNIFIFYLKYIYLRIILKFKWEYNRKILLIALTSISYVVVK